MTPSFKLTEKQVLQRDLAADPDLVHILGFGGSRSGKTFGFCRCVAARALSAPTSRHLISRSQNIDVRQSVMMDTWPNMMRKAFPGVPFEVNKSDQYCIFGNTSEVWFGGLDDKERVEKILGKEYATIYVNETSQVAYETILTLRTRLAQNVTKVNGKPLSLKCYYDLNPVGRGHWTYKEFVEGVRPENGLPFTKKTRAYLVMNPTDNVENLPQAYLDELQDLPERQRQRFYEGKYLSEVPNTLWPVERIDANRVEKAPVLQRIVVALDPSGSDGTGGDRQGIVVAGKADGVAYVLEDASVRLPPAGWAAKATERYSAWEADMLIAEINYGGAMVKSTIYTADPNCNVKVTNASRGKHIRAEPVASLYEKGKVKHVGRFPEMEAQMGMFTTTGYQGGDSPDRVDALVWALTELMLGNNFDGIIEHYRRSAQDQDEEEAEVPDDEQKTKLFVPVGVSTVSGRDGSTYVITNGQISARSEDVPGFIANGFVRVIGSESTNARVSDEAA